MPSVAGQITQPMVDSTLTLFNDSRPAGSTLAATVEEPMNEPDHPFMDERAASQSLVLDQMSART